MTRGRQGQRLKNPNKEEPPCKDQLTLVPQIVGNGNELADRGGPYKRASIRSRMVYGSSMDLHSN